MQKNAWVACKDVKISGIHYDGGYAEYMVAPVDALARIPDKIDMEHAGPLMCAGITVYNSMRNAGKLSGDLCLVQGIGGLGHLAIQFGNKMGFKVVAISSGKDKEALAKKLGAHIYLDASSVNIIEEIQKLGGADLIVATAPTAKAVSDIIPALGINGKLLLVAAVHEPIQTNGGHLLSHRASISGWASGDSRDSEDTLNFAVNTGIEAMIETFPLEKAQEGFEKMLSNKARFRNVLKIK